MVQHNDKTWTLWERTLRCIEVVAIVAGVIYAGMQLSDVRNMQSAQLMLTFNDDLSTATNAGITTAIEDGKPLFIGNGGQYATTSIDLYLGDYELLNNVFQAGLISNDMLYNGFSYDIVKTYQNPEIRNYLADIQKGDPTLFSGFEQLAQSLQAIQ